MTGWIAERQGRYDEAIRCYLASLQTSSFSDQSIRFRTHWFPEPFGRFAAYRLWQLRDHLSAHQRPDALLQCYWSSSPGLRQRVYEYWITQADLAAEQGSPAAEYDALYRAGWDLGVDDLTGYGPLLQRMADAAQRAGQHARAEVARTHCNCLIQRF